jgi:uncharacterized protein YwgA
MRSQENLWSRLAAIIRMVELCPKGLGHTALMKLVYLLQSLKKTPLGYRFKLYTYGPYDAAVLDDLNYVESLGGLKKTTKQYQNGFCYIIHLDDESQVISQQILVKAKDFLAEHDTEIQSIVSDFSHFSASELELIGTIVYAQQELPAHYEQNDDEIVQRVKEIKPHFSQEQIQSKFQWLSEKNHTKPTLRL